MSFASGNKPIEVVDIETAQTLVNKTLTAPVINDGDLVSPEIDGGTIVDASITSTTKLEPRHGTRTELETYALTTTDGQIVFDTTNKETLEIRDHELVKLAGGGAGGSDIYFSHNLDGEGKITDWVSSTTISTTEEETLPLNGKKSVKINFGATSDVADFVSLNMSSNERCKSVISHKATFAYSYDGPKGAIYVTVTGGLPSSELTKVILDPNKNRASIVFGHRFNTSEEQNLRFVVADTSVQNTSLVIDDIEFSDKGFCDTEITIDETIKTTGRSGMDGGYILFGTTESDSDNKLLSDTSSIRTQYTFQNDCKYTLSCSTQGAADHDVVVYHLDSNGVTMNGFDAEASNNGRCSVSGIGFAKQGDTIQVYCTVIPDDNDFTNFSVTATAQSSRTLIVDEMEQAYVVASLKLEGNDGRVITSNTESIPFNGTSEFWTAGSDGSSATSGNYYTVQKDNTTIEASTTIGTTAAVNSVLQLYLNGAMYAALDGYNDNKYYPTGMYKSKVGEFNAGDKIAFCLGGAGATLYNSNVYHYLNITETYFPPASQKTLPTTFILPEGYGGTFGGNIGNSDIYGLLNAEDESDMSNWTKTGTDTDSIEYNYPLAGFRSYKITSDGNDSSRYVEVQVPERSRLDINKLSFVSRHNDAKDVAYCEVYDVTNSKVLSSTMISPSTQAQRHQVLYSLDPTTATIRFTYKLVNPTSGKEFVFDDVEFSDKAYDTGSVTISGAYTAVNGSQSSTGTMTLPTTITKNEPNDLFSIGPDCVVTILKDNVLLNISASIQKDGGDDSGSYLLLRESRDGGSVEDIAFGGVANGLTSAPARLHTASASSIYNNGDIVTVYCNIAAASADKAFSVTATAQSDTVQFEDSYQQGHFVGKAVYNLSSQYSTASTSYILPSLSLTSSALSGKLEQNTVNAPSLTIPNARIGTYTIHVTGDEMFNNGAYGTVAIYDGTSYYSEQAHAQGYIGGFTLVYENRRNGDVNLDLMIKTTTTFYFGAIVPLELSVSYLPPVEQASTTRMLAVKSSLENDFDVEASSTGVLSNFNGAADWCEFDSRGTYKEYYYDLNTNIYSDFPLIASETTVGDGVILSIAYGTFPRFSVHGRTYSGTDVDVAHQISAKKRGADRSDRHTPVVNGDDVVKEKVMNFILTGAGSTSGDGSTLAINSMQGDVFYSVLNDQLTLPTGEYQLEISVSAYETDYAMLSLNQITNAVGIIAQSRSYSYPSGHCTTTMTIKRKLVLDEPTTFEFLAKEDTSGGNFSTAFLWSTIRKIL